MKKESETTVSASVEIKEEPRKKEFVADCEWLMDQWDFEKNQGLFDPHLLTVGSKKEPWWKCEQGHTYSQQINAKYGQKQGCPYCSGKRVLPGFNDLATTDPDIAREWSPLNNLKPTEVTRGSGKEVMWECKVCKQSWSAKIHLRALNKTGCPYCSHNMVLPGVSDLETLFPSIAAEWDNEKNSDNPSDYTAYSKHRAYWKCPACQNSYPMAIQSRTQQNQGCPICAKRWQTSFPEQAIYYYLKSVFPDCINKAYGILPGKMELDIYIPSKKTAIEYDGQRWHSEEETKDNERKKYSECKKQGIFLIRVRESGLKTTEENADYYLATDYDQGKKIHKLIPMIIEIGKIMDVRLEPTIDRDEIKIRNQYIQGIKQSSAGYRYPELLEEWDQDKNGSITLYMLSPGDSTRYSWKCKQCGHTWKASINHRVSGEGCPKCARKKASENSVKTLIKVNGSLLDRFPQLAKEWDYEKNSDNPSQVTAMTNKKVFWICERGHSYQASISDRTSKGSGCPFCDGKLPVIGENDLQTTHPELMLDWDYSRNDLPMNYKAGSNKYVWWKCHICGNEWQTPVYSRALYGRGCKKCSVEKRKLKTKGR